MKKHVIDTDIVFTSLFLEEVLAGSTSQLSAKQLVVKFEPKTTESIKATYEVRYSTHSSRLNSFKQFDSAIEAVAFYNELP